MTKKTQLVYSLVSVCAVIAYCGFLVKNSISEVDVAEETLPYENILKEDVPPAPTEPVQVSAPVAEELFERNMPTEKPTEKPTEEIIGFTPVFPVSGSITSEFSLEPVYNSVTKDWRSHVGVDIAANLTDAVVAIEDGTVTDCYTDPMWGNVIKIDHGEYVSIYKNLSTLIMVKEGDSVTRGEKISGVGTSSVAEMGEAHLHFELMHYSEYIDPLPLLS